MLIYSKTINHFLQGLKQQIRKILQEEMGLTVHRQRFEYAGMLYPINPVVFEGEKTLGFFDPHSYQIGINKKLMTCASHHFIQNILRHELCHLYLHIKNIKCTPHGPEFKEHCLHFGWGPEVYRASSEVNKQKLLTGQVKSEERILQRVKKLLKLSESSNPHEAQTAASKANQLIVEHNLQVIQTDEMEEEVYVKRVLKSKRNNQKLKSIYEILKYFFIQPVFSYSQRQVYLEIIGEKIHVEIADYMAKFLDHEMERLWTLAKNNNPSLKGLKSKNSFFNGLAQGFCTQIKKERCCGNTDSKALISLEKKLEHKVNLVYSRLSSAQSRETHRCQESLTAGQKLGARMNIRQGIGQALQNRLLR